MAVRRVFNMFAHYGKFFSRSGGRILNFSYEKNGIKLNNPLSRWCLSSSRCYSTDTKERNLMTDIINRIKASGSLSVAAYMQEVLTSPSSGYYMKRDVFGQSGDFITSPEISQVFGELVGVWFVYHWLLTGKDKIQLVELGPGRGTLMADILRVLKKFKVLEEKISIHLVEVSPVLSEIQAKLLTGSNSKIIDKSSTLSYRQGKTDVGIPVAWYHGIHDVPDGNTFYLAHEFFDALPIHQFKKTDQGWREVFIDIDKTKPSALRFVLAPGPTVASESLVPRTTSSQEIEVCPQGGAVIEHMAGVIKQHGGAALIVDYGQYGCNRFSLRAFKNHALHDVLIDPGTADMTANVDFQFLEKSLSGKAQPCGPVTQQAFLKEMGIDERMKVLLSNATDSQAKQLQSGYKMLMEDMGTKFKFFAVTQHGIPKPPGFSDSFGRQKTEC